MRARLRKFLPLVLLALVMQVLAPVAACLAAGQAVGDPLSAGVICHSAGEQGGLNDQTGTPAHAGACALCCLAQANASLDSPQPRLPTAFRSTVRVVWHDTDVVITTSYLGSNARARAPPRLT